MKYSKDMKVNEILFNEARNIGVFKKYGLPCSTCLGAENETLEIVCRVNNVDINMIIKDLNNKKNACV